MIHRSPDLAGNIQEFRRIVVLVFKFERINGDVGVSKWYCETEGAEC